MELDNFPSAGGLFFSLLLMLVVFWIAKKRSFFQLPPPTALCPVSFVHTLGAFLTYLLFSFIVVPTVLAFILLWIKGEAISVKALPPQWLGWIQFIALCILFCLFIVYCLMIQAQARRYIFWGEGNRNFKRFFKSVGMGITAWIVSYPFVLVVSFLTRLLSILIWGEFDTEQVAVRQLKKTMDNPYLFVSMAFAAVVLVPFLEELLFRGFLQNFLKRLMLRRWAIILTAAIFSIVHFSPSQGIGNFQLILSLFALSLFLGFIYERERTLWAPMALHMVFNAFTVLILAFQ